MYQKNLSTLWLTNKIFYIILSILIINSCGYKMAGVSKDTFSSKYYISEIINKDAESDYYNIMNNEIYHFFSEYGLLEKQQKADYELRFILDKVDTDMVTKTETEQAVASQIEPILHIIVRDKKGETLFDKKYRYYEIYYVTSNISGNIQRRYDAFREALNYILLDFRSDFERYTKK